MNLELIKSLYYLKSYFSLYGKIEESFLCAAFIPFLATSFFICRVLPTGRMGGGESLHQLKICLPPPPPSSTWKNLPHQIFASPTKSQLPPLNNSI